MQLLRKGHQACCISDNGAWAASKLGPIESLMCMQALVDPQNCNPGMDILQNSQARHA